MMVRLWRWTLRDRWFTAKTGESLQETAPHLWPRAQGAGPTGDRGGKSGKKWGDFTETERAQMAREDPKGFDQLMKTRGG